MYLPAAPLGLLTMSLLIAVLAAGACAGPDGAPTEPNDPRMGQYLGTCDHGGDLPAPANAMVVGEGDGKHRILLYAQTAPATSLELASDADGNLSGEGAEGRFTPDGKLNVSAGGKTFALQRVAVHSPTEGAPPPPGAVVLLAYDPANPARPSLDAWTNTNWTPLPDGSVLVGKGDNRTKRSFGDCRLHVEFRVPYMPDKRGQGRGNSGVYLQDRYEVQVLDSFGLPPRDNHCGGIYKVAAPAGDADLPPGQWQTYDIAFTAPKFDDSGKLVAPARIRVRHNGVLIHDDQPIPRPTGGGQSDIAPTGPIKLQDHGNPVRYRNIWLLEK